MRTIMMRCLRCLFPAMLLMPGFAAAQSAVGSSCAVLDSVNGEQAFVLDQPVAAGQWIIVSAAASDTSVEFASTPVTDSGNNAYSAYDATLMAGDSGVLAIFAGRATTAMQVGDQVTVHYVGTGSTVAQGCVSVAAFSSVQELVDPSDGYGENYGTGVLQQVNVAYPTGYPCELVYSAFASADAPGAITVYSPSRGLGQVCSTDAALCVAPAWNLGANTTGTFEDAAASSANSTTWGAMIVTFRSDDRIFANGFD
jgi:hypothetical protein